MLARHAPGAHVLVQVNVAGEPQKGGCAPDGRARPWSTGCGRTAWPSTGS